MTMFAAPTQTELMKQCPLKCHAAMIERLEKLRGDSVEIWAMSQLLPGEGIEDAVGRIESYIQQIINEFKEKS